jgi:hypothetical protein
MGVGGGLPVYSFWESWIYIGFAGIRRWKEEHRSGIRVGLITLQSWEEIKQVGVVKEQKSYIEILESQNAMLREEHEALSRLSAGISVPFVKAGHLLSLKRFLEI